MKFNEENLAIGLLVLVLMVGYIVFISTSAGTCAYGAPLDESLFCELI